MTYIEQGTWLRQTKPEPKHVCPAPRDADARDIWMCACGRTYIWSGYRGYGFEWCRVILRAPFYKFAYGLRRQRDISK